MSEEIQLALWNYTDSMRKYKLGLVTREDVEKTESDYRRTVDMYTWRSE